MATKFSEIYELLQSSQSSEQSSLRDVFNLPENVTIIKYYRKDGLLYIECCLKPEEHINCSECGNELRFPDDRNKSQAFVIRKLRHVFNHGPAMLIALLSEMTEKSSKLFLYKCCCRRDCISGWPKSQHKTKRPCSPIKHA